MQRDDRVNQLTALCTLGGARGTRCKLSDSTQTEAAGPRGCPAGPVPPQHHVQRRCSPTLCESHQNLRLTPGSKQAKGHGEREVRQDRSIKWTLERALEP